MDVVRNRGKSNPSLLLVEIIRRTLADTFHSYTWDSESNPVKIDSINLTYDAFDRVVEQNPSSGTYYQIVYTPMGKKLGLFKGTTIQQLYVPLPGGAHAEYYSWGLSDYRHPDWLGSDRLESSTTRTIIDNNAYAPFGEPYEQTGNGEISFTGQNKDTDWLQYDFLARQYDPKQGRWISPDPAGVAAVDITNPQTWNRYAYVGNNPLSFSDKLGLNRDATGSSCNPDLMDCGSGGGSPSSPGGGDTGYYLDGLGVSAGTAGRLLSSGGGVECPNDTCSGFSSSGQYGQFFAFAGGTQGYYNPGDLSQGINEANGHLFTNGQYSAYIQATYASQIEAQRQALARAIAANSGISYEQALADLETNGGHLQGGNWNFVADGLTPSSLDCGGDPRCNGVHFPGQDSNGNFYVHLDTSNPFTGPAGFLEHGFVDLFLGNVAYTVIPRPWP